MTFRNYLKNFNAINKIITIFFVLFFITSKANGDTYLKLDSCDLCVKAIQKLQIPILKNKIHFTPIIGWNNYDKTQVGIAFYSKPKLKNIDFILAPLFGIGSKTLTGYAHFKYAVSIKENKLLKLGFLTKRFSYLAFPENLNYNKIEPFISFKIKNITENKHQAQIDFKTSFVLLDYLYQGKQQEFYYVNHLSFKYDFNKTKDNFSAKIDLKQATTFVSVSGEFKTKINYPTKKHNAFYARLFVGGFLYNANFNTANLAPSPDANFLLSANNRPYLGNTTNAFTQYQEDYSFRNTFFDRNSQDPFFSRQIGTHSDGGFKSLTNNGKSKNYLVALNLSTDIPIPVPIEPWVNIALIEGINKPELAAEFGASLNLFNKFLQFHFLFVSTKNIAPIKFSDNISFSVDLMKLNELRMY